MFFGFSGHDQLSCGCAKGTKKIVSKATLESLLNRVVTHFRAVFVMRHSKGLSSRKEKRFGARCSQMGQDGQLRGRQLGRSPRDTETGRAGAAVVPGSSG